MAFASIEQLRTKSWRSRDAAVKELKRNGFTERGTDYEIREVSPQSWQICPLDEPPPLPPVVPAKKSALQRIKQAAPVKSAKTPAGSRKSSARMAPAAAVSTPPASPVAPLASDGATDVPTARPAAALAALADAVAAEVSHDAPTAPLASNVTSLFPDIPPAGSDLSPLAARNEPFYAVRIDASHIRQTSVVLHALELSRQTKLPMAICDPDGAVLRVIDQKAVVARRKTDRPARAGAHGVRAPRGEGKTARGVALLLRPEGATAAELSETTGWPIGLRHINRLAKVSQSRIETVADKHWRLVKPSK